MAAWQWFMFTAAAAAPAPLPAAAHGHESQALARRARLVERDARRRRIEAEDGDLFELVTAFLHTRSRTTWRH